MRDSSGQTDASGCPCNQTETSASALPRRSFPLGYPILIIRHCHVPTWQSSLPTEGFGMIQRRVGEVDGSSTPGLGLGQVLISYAHDDRAP
jgi:hypothetical protein